MTEDREKATEDAINEVLDELLEDYGHLLSPSDQKGARKLLANVLATHPVTADLLELIIPAPVVERSDKVAKQNDVADKDIAVGGNDD